MEARHQPIELILEKFKKELAEKNYISELTGCILFDPILIPGASNYEEREFIARCIQSKKKNPFTRQAMSLDDLDLIETNTQMQDEINRLISDFYLQHKDHPDHEAIRKAIETERYQPESVITVQSESKPNHPQNPTEDDLIAMADAAGGGDRNQLLADHSLHNALQQFRNNFRPRSNPLSSQFSVANVNALINAFQQSDTDMHHNNLSAEYSYSGASHYSSSTTLFGGGLGFNFNVDQHQSLAEVRRTRIEEYERRRQELQNHVNSLPEGLRNLHRNTF